MAKKPLVFVEPLSPTFKKLQEVLAPIAEAEGIEIFTTSDINEAMQLIPNIDPSLTLLSDPKVTAILLKGQGKKIAKQNSKIMLLSKQKIPQKSLEKMMKYGLSECVVEPIQPKSLLYKVKLLLRSLPSQDKKEKELSLKSSEGIKKEENENKIEKNKNSSTADGQLPEEEKENEKGQSTQGEEESYLQGEVKNKNEGNDIDSHYQGKISKNKMAETEEDLYKRPEKEKDKPIESHYKGSLTENAKEEEEKNDTEIKNVNKDIIDDRLKGKMGEGVLELENEDENSNKEENHEDIYQDSKIKKSQNLDLDLESELDSKNKQNKDEDDKYLKGKIQERHEEEKKEKNNSETNSMPSSQEQNLIGKSNNNSLSLEEEEEYKEKNNTLSFEEEEKKNKKEDSLNGINSENAEKESSKNENLAGPEDYLKEYKSKNKQESDSDSDNQMYERKKDEEDKNIRSKQSSDLDLDLENDKELGLKNLEDKEDFKKKRKAEQSLDFEQEDHSENGQDEKSDTQDLYQSSGKKNKSTLGSEIDDTNNQDLLKSSETEENENKNKRSEKKEEDQSKSKKNKNDQLDLEQDDYRQKEKDEKDQEENSRREWVQRTEEEKKEREKEKRTEQEMEWKDINLDKKTEEDKIKREKAQEEQANWENIKINKKQEVLDSEKSQYDKEMIIKKEERGEQTIDYAKLKEEFGIIDKYGRDAIKNAYSFEETGGTPGSYSSKVKGAVPYSVEINETPEEKEVEEDIISSVDFPPDAKGLEHAINILNFIENKNIKEEEIFVQIAQTILQEYLGHSVFFRSNIKTYEIENIFKVDSDYIRQQYETFKHLYFEMWKSIPLPYWSDETFQSKEMFFVFPFFEGTKSLGFAICFFPQGIKQEISPRVEILFECARTLYLDYAHSNAIKGTYVALANKSKEEESTVEKVFGKLTSWFKKAG